LLPGILTPAETFHFAVGISRSAAARLCGTLDLAHIIGRAITDAALDVPISIPHRAASRLGTEHLAILVHCALPFATHYISIRVLEAIRGEDAGAGAQK